MPDSGWGEGVGRYYLISTEFQFCKMKRMVVKVVQHCEYTSCHSSVYFKAAKVVNFMLCEFLSQLKIIKQINKKFAKLSM